LSTKNEKGRKVARTREGEKKQKQVVNSTPKKRKQKSYH
jgi:hypothetical protein